MPTLEIPGIATLHGDHPLALARHNAGHYGSTVRLACPVVIHWTREGAAGMHFDFNYDCFLSRADADAWLSSGVDGLVAVVEIAENPWPPADPDAWQDDPSWLGV